MIVEVVYLSNKKLGNYFYYYLSSEVFYAL